MQAELFGGQLSDLPRVVSSCSVDLDDLARDEMDRCG
jgi:hypothetical protein